MSRLAWLLMLTSPLADLLAQPLSGVVYDQQQQGIAGATLRRVGSWQSIQTDSSGQYRWTDLSAGKHQFLITAAGYLPTLRSAYLADSVPTILNVGLLPAPATLLAPYAPPAQLPPIDPLDLPCALFSLSTSRLASSPSPSPFTPEHLQALPATWLIQPSPGLGRLVVRGLADQELTQTLDGIRLAHSALGPEAPGALGLIDPWLLQAVALAPSGPLPEQATEGLGGSLGLRSRSVAYRDQGVAWGGRGQGRLQAPGLMRQGRFETQFASQRLTLLMGLSLHGADHRVAGGDSLLQPSDYRSRSLDFKLRQRLGQGSELTLAHQQVQQSDLPNYERQRWQADTLARYPSRQRSLTYLRWVYRHPSPWWQHLALTTSLQRWSTVERRSDERLSSALVRRNQLLSVGFTGRLLSRPRPGWEVRTGLACYRDLAGSAAQVETDSLGMGPALPSAYANGGHATLWWVFQQHTWEVGPWLLSARAQGQGSELALSTATFGDQQRRTVALTGTLGSVYRLRARRRLFGQLHSGAQLPSLYDLSQLGPQTDQMVVPNPSLRSARNATLSFGYRQRGRPWTLSGSLFGRYGWGLPALLPARYRDSTQYQGLPVFQWQNAAQRRSLGGEVAWEWQQGAWSCHGNLGYVLAQQGTGEWVPQLPPLHGRLGLRYARAGGWVQTTLVGAAAQTRLAPADLPDPRIPQGGSAAWGQIDLSLGYGWDWGQISLQAINLLDAKIRPHASGIPRYGRSGSLELAAWF